MWKLFWKSSIALGDIAPWNVLMFLKIVTKWREIQKSKLNNSLTNWAFQKTFSHSILSRRAFLKLFIPSHEKSIFLKIRSFFSFKFFQGHNWLTNYSDSEFHDHWKTVTLSSISPNLSRHSKPRSPWGRDQTKIKTLIINGSYPSCNISP